MFWGKRRFPRMCWNHHAVAWARKWGGGQNRHNQQSFTKLTGKFASIRVREGKFATK